MANSIHSLQTLAALPLDGRVFPRTSADVKEIFERLLLPTAPNQTVADFDRACVGDIFRQDRIDVDGQWQR